MIRMSALPITQFCGAAAKLSREHGAGRAAAMGTAFHAKIAGSPDAPRLLSLLTPEEREEVESWKTPTPVTYRGQTVTYEQAFKEVEVCLDGYGFSCKPEHAVTIGHLDFAWIVQDGNERIALVPDVKRSIWTTPSGPESLQMHAYARAFASMHDCTHYVTAIWAAVEGEWLWSKNVVELESDEAERLFMRIYHAATRSDSEYASGQHCQSCWNRLQCPEYAIPAHTADSWLMPFSEPDFYQKLSTYTPEERGELLCKLQAVKAVCEIALKQTSTAIDRGLPFYKDGKTYRLVQVKGRESVSISDLRAGLGEEAEKYISKGDPFKRPQWCNQ